MSKDGWEIIRGVAFLILVIVAFTVFNAWRAFFITLVILLAISAVMGFFYWLRRRM